MTNTINSKKVTMEDLSDFPEIQKAVQLGKVSLDNCTITDEIGESTATATGSIDGKKFVLTQVYDVELGQAHDVEASYL